MSQRGSGYKRIKNDEYNTPPWVIETLWPHIPHRVFSIFDPCCGKGNVVKTLNRLCLPHAVEAYGKDLQRDGYDYLKDKSWKQAIVTNPPFKLAEKFIFHAVTHSTFVAMLLRCDYDHAITRKYLFADYPQFAKKIALTKRIVWFEREGAAPSFNHAWFIWQSDHKGPPTLAYAP